MNDVEVFLETGRRHAREPDALAAIMGEDWAELKLGHPRKVLQMDFLMRQNLARTKHRPAIGVSVVQGRPQALVKLIGKGGASSAKGLRDQMTYLSRHGSVELQRSERYFGAPVDAAEAAKLQMSWGMDKPGEARVAQTSHFVVSFPAGTDRDAAERAGRAWAEEMFESGRFGDQWDYYTAYHRDTAYPHIHVVVSRRGMEKGDWLKVSNRGALTFDALREVQVEVSEREGLFLEASPRLARGVHARPVPDAEYRRAQEMGRAPVPPAHSEVSAAASAAAVLYHARRYAADAALIEDKYPELAAELSQAATRLEHGLSVQDVSPAEILVEGEDAEIAMAIDKAKDDIRASFGKMDREVAEVPDPAERASIQRQIAELKADALRFMPDDPELVSFAHRATDQRYHGVQADRDDPDIGPLIAAANIRVREIAQEIGVDPDATIERYSLGPVSQGLADTFERDELAELQAARRGQISVRGARQILASMHDTITGVYSTARDKVRDIHARRQAVSKERDPDTTPRERGRSLGDDDFGL